MIRFGIAPFSWNIRRRHQRHPHACRRAGGQAGRRAGGHVGRRAREHAGTRARLNDCSMKHYIVVNMARFSHAHVTISAEIKLTHACSRGDVSHERTAARRFVSYRDLGVSCLGARWFLRFLGPKLELPISNAYSDLYTGCDNSIDVLHLW